LAIAQIGRQDNKRHRPIGGAIESAFGAT